MIAALEILGVLLVATVANSLVFAVFGAMLAPWARLFVTEISLGLGPKVLERTWKGIHQVVRLVPITSYLKVAGMNPFAEDPAPPPPFVLWSDAPKLRVWVALIACPRLVVLGATVLMLGPARALRAIGEGSWQVFAGIWSGQSMLTAAEALSHSVGIVVLVGMVLSKLIAFDLVVSAIPDSIGLLVRAPKLAASVKPVFSLGAFLLVAIWVVHFVVWSARSMG